MLMLMLACGGEPAEQVFTGEIFTDAETVTTALAVTDGVVVATGADAEALIGDDTQTIALTGTAFPGFHDAHAHFLPGSFVMERLVMLGTGSMNSVLSAVEDYAEEAPSEPWIIGFGWVHALVEDPSGVAIDAVVSDRPVILVDSSGHAALVNSAALNAAGITADTPDPIGGEIVRDPKTGEPTGLLLEEALSLITPVALADYNDEQFLTPLREQLATLPASGITSISEILASPGLDLTWPWLYETLENSGELPVRVYYYVPLFSTEDVESVAALAGVYDGERVRFAGAKVWVDGSMGTAQSWVSEPHEGTDDEHGSHYFTAEQILDVVARAEAVGLPLKFHANGDAAVAAVLDALEAVAPLSQPHVLDHAVLIDEADYARISALGLVVSVQPPHALVAAFGDSAEAWGSERFARAYDYTTLESYDIPMALGTDWPVWPTLHVANSLWSAVGVEHPMSLAAALTAYTAGGAAAVGQDGVLGCLSVGCTADITVLSESPWDVEPAELSGLTVEAVYLAGEVID
ncbi:MAG: putative amidohydrolase YtcJ [Myxococcota bacterium]|jgi:predicted amidohydrolase YtcJ